MCCWYYGILNLTQVSALFSKTCWEATESSQSCCLGGTFNAIYREIRDLTNISLRSVEGEDSSNFSPLSNGCLTQKIAKTRCCAAMGSRSSRQRDGARATMSAQDLKSETLGDRIEGWFPGTKISSFALKWLPGYNLKMTLNWWSKSSLLILRWNIFWWFAQ